MLLLNNSTLQKEISTTYRLKKWVIIQIMSGLQAPKENGTAEVEPTCTGSENSEALTAREVELILDTWSDVQKNLQEAGRVMFVK